MRGTEQQYIRDVTLALTLCAACRVDKPFPLRQWYPALSRPEGDVPASHSIGAVVGAVVAAVEPPEVIS